MKNKKNLFLYVFLVIGIQIISNKLLEYDTILSNSLSDQLTQEQLLDYLRLRKDLEWVGYIVMPIILFIKISLIAAIIDVGCFFFEKEIKYKKLFNIVVKAEFIFLGVILLKTGLFLFFMPNYTLEDLQYFYPLSLINLIDYREYKTWFIYPLQIVNLFEIVYWFLLANLLGKSLKLSTEKSLTIIASSYGIGLLIWIIAVMFFTLNMS
jgi:hypothetical protein